MTLVLVAVAVAGARGDTIRVGKIPYSGARITNVRDGWIHFRMGAGRPLAKPLRRISFLEIDGEGDLNRAEQLLADGEPTRAVTEYDRAIKGATGWVAELIRYRRVVALDRSGRIARATKEWLALVDDSNDPVEVLKLRPITRAPKGSPQNADAIRLLEAKLETVETRQACREQIRALLLKLYQREQRNEEATKLAGRMTDEAQRKPPVSEGSGRLEALEILMEQGKHERAFNVLKANLGNGRYASDELPLGLLLAGKAQQKLSREVEGPERRKLLIDAGLDLMHVATFFGGWERAPEALMGAAEVNVALGNFWAGENAYKAVIRRYPDSAAGRRAALELRTLKREGRFLSTDDR